MTSLALTMMGVASLPAPAQAQWGDSFSAGEARNARDKGDVVPLRDIFKQLRQRYGGYQIDANLYEQSGRQMYVIDWMTEKGERVRVNVDARTGQIQS
ncbi:MAG: peptidase [Pseudomonadota bacterium]